MKLLRRAVEDPVTVDAVVVVLGSWFVLGAYVVSYAYVRVPGTILHGYATAGQTIVTASWALLTLFLFAGFAAGLRAGRVWNRALPDGQTGSLAAALVFGAAWIVDYAFWTPLAPAGSIGLDSLFTPPHLVEIAAAAIIVSGPLRAATRRGEAVASPIALTSAALLLSVFTFATQFAHPLIDPWPAANYEFRIHDVSLGWIGENLGMAALLAQAAILAGTGLLLNSAFRLRPGSLAYVFTLNGIYVVVTKGRFWLLPVPIFTGLAADAWTLFTARRPGKPSASLTAVIGAAFAFAYMVAIAFDGTVWGPSLWAGAIIASTVLCWLMGRLLRAGLPAAVISPMLELREEAPPAPAPPGQWTLDPDSGAREQLVRAALDDLGTPEALGRSPLAQLPGVSKGDSAAVELRALLVDVIGELAASTSPRDAESGHLLLDYYVKRVGSHEVIMERLHLSRPTYYRRLHHGFELVASRLDRLSVVNRAPSTP